MVSTERCVAEGIAKSGMVRQGWRAIGRGKDCQRSMTTNGMSYGRRIDGKDARRDALVPNGKAMPAIEHARSSAEQIRSPMTGP